MSAFLCSVPHIARLAVEAEKVPVPGLKLFGNRSQHQVVLLVAKLLANVNVSAIKERYGSYDEEDFVEGGFEAYVNSCAQQATEWVEDPPYVSTVALLKMIACYRYQCAEIDWWKGTLAYKQVEMLEKHLICTLPGYSEAPWCWEGK